MLAAPVKACRAGLERLFGANLALYHQLMRILHARHVRAVVLKPGEYPPIEHTRIVAREDGTRGDNFVICQVLETGYLWNGNVLRKVAVTVISQPEVLPVKATVSDKDDNEAA